MKTKTKNWFKLAFQFRGSVILAIYQRVIGFGLFSFIVSVLYEEIGLEIENPFGYDPNDLPLDAICNTIKYDIEEFITCNVDLPSKFDKFSQNYDQQL